MSAPRFNYKQAATSDADFMRLFQQMGPYEMSRHLGQNVGSIYKRRRNLEALYGTQIRAPDIARSTRRAEDHAAIIPLKVQNGIVLVGSDAHIWPGDMTTAMRAFVKFCKDMRPAAAIMNGDVMDFPQVSRHPPIGHQKLPDLAEEIEAAQEQLQEIELATPKSCKLVWPLGNHDCLDSQTECLTKRGWLPYHDLRPSDEVLSLDGASSVWTRINEVVSFPYSGDLIRVEKTRMSMAVTPNHRVLLDRLNWRSKKFDIREFRRADDLPHNFNIPVSGEVDNLDFEIPDDAIALVGWLLTDGSYDKCNISIYQSKVTGCVEIERILNSLQLSYSKYQRQRERKVVCGRMLLHDPLPANQYLIRASSSRIIRNRWLKERGRLPEWANNLSGRQFGILLDAIVAGDGVWDGPHPDAKTCAVVYGREEILSSIQAVAVLHGWRARVSKDNRGDYRLCLSREPKIRINDPSEIFKEAYDGVVWCLRVPLENFMVRRNGCAYFTGNSRFETRLATVAPEYARLHGHSLKDHFPAWSACWRCDINDDVTVKHRHKGGIHAPHNSTMWAGKTMVTGHLHSQKVTPFTDYNGTRYGVDTGMLGAPDAQAFLDYTEGNPLNWRSGFAVLTFKNGRLLFPELVTVWDEKHVQFRGEVIKV